MAHSLKIPRYDEKCIHDQSKSYLKFWLKSEKKRIPGLYIMALEKIIDCIYWFFNEVLLGSSPSCGLAIFLPYHTKISIHITYRMSVIGCSEDSKIGNSVLRPDWISLHSSQVLFLWKLILYTLRCNFSIRCAFFDIFSWAF